MRLTTGAIVGGLSRWPPRRRRRLLGGVRRSNTTNEAAAATTPAAYCSDIVRLLLLDEGNPSSIRSCLTRARGNGRAVRTALTQDMWEALNDDWRRLDQYDVARARHELPTLLDWVKIRASTFRGAVEPASSATKDMISFALAGRLSAPR